MKYKDFKPLSVMEMKRLLGGKIDAKCSASATCANGSSVSCEGVTAPGTYGGGGTFDCLGNNYNSSGNSSGIGQASCPHYDSAEGVYAMTYVTCGGS